MGKPYVRREAQLKAEVLQIVSAQSAGRHWLSGFSNRC